MTTTFASHFVTKSRDEGNTFFYTFAEGAPEWLQEAVRAAHHGALPNDWVFEVCRDAVEAIDAGDLDLEDEDDDDVHNFADGQVDVYTKDLFQWAADFCLTDTWSSAEQEAMDMGGLEEMDTSKRLAAIQYAALRHIADTMKQACAKAAEQQVRQGAEA